MASIRFMMILAVAGGVAMMTSCSQAAAPSSATAPAARLGEDSILVGSSPAAGSTTSGEVEELRLHFNPPARLDEVIVTGPQGSMPMMVSSADETESYSLPLSGLEPGSYSVSWRATAKGREYRGSFEFKVAS